jgi:NTP pyrophosphatase (non-canonical NTP hydrolase)
MISAMQLDKNGIPEDEAYIAIKAKIRENLSKELTDCLAYLCKLANLFEFNLEDELHSKLEEIRFQRLHHKK